MALHERDPCTECKVSKEPRGQAIASKSMSNLTTRGLYAALLFGQIAVLSAEETGNAAAESRNVAQNSLQDWLFAGGALVATAVGIALVAINDGHEAH